ncbi:hypothetical protein AYJ66_05795 [Dietzia cinnamea]|nr:hypothetical protein AYJ66_05795 [Dietzia cinnamea]
MIHPTIVPKPTSLPPMDSVTRSVSSSRASSWGGDAWVLRLEQVLGHGPAAGDIGELADSRVRIEQAGVVARTPAAGRRHA